MGTEMIDTVYGVDFSGAKRPGKTTWVAALEGVEYLALRRRCLDLESHLAADVRQRAQVHREDDSDHGSVCTSTE